MDEKSEDLSLLENKITETSRQGVEGSWLAGLGHTGVRPG